MTAKPPKPAFIMRTKSTPKNDEKTNGKADFILLGIDVHLNKGVVRRQVDGQGPQPAQTLRREETLLRFIDKQRTAARMFTVAMRPARWATGCTGGMLPWGWPTTW